MEFNVNFDAKFRVFTENAIFFELIHESARLPKRADSGSSCYDLFSVESFVINPGEVVVASTGLKWKPVSNEIEMQIRPRSGLAAKNGITVLNSPGTVDASYRKEIKVILINHGKLPYTVEKGDRIAQAFFQKVDKSFEIIETIEPIENDTDRTGGLGSTGR